jgi:hypothetical protein
MWSLNFPKHTAADTFNACISRVKNPALKARLKAASPSVVAADVNYSFVGGHQLFHTVPRSSIVLPDITTEEMETVYSTRMARKDAPGRHVYDDIFSSSPNGKCPLCAQRMVTTLDHFLPKSHYPALAVTPLNLLPSCHDCNKLKSSLFPNSIEEVPLHPYFDVIDNVRWLGAEAVEVVPSALRFFVTAPPIWDDILIKRVETHFRLLELAKLYAAEAAEELLNVRHQLTTIFQVAGENGVKDELQQRANSCAQVRVNGWRAATYGAWATSDWFCAGGFYPTG